MMPKTLIVGVSVGLFLSLIGFAAGTATRQSREATGSGEITIEMDDGTVAKFRVSGLVNATRVPHAGKIDRVAFWAEDSGEGEAWRFEIRGPVDYTVESPDEPPTGLAEDDFDSSELGQFWSVVDPKRASSFEVQDGRLIAWVHSVHDLWTEGNGTARCFQTIPAGESFDVAFELSPQAIPDGGMVGLHLAESDESFYRLEIQRRGGLKAFFAPINGGQVGRVKKRELGDGHRWLRFSFQGAGRPARASVSDGESWSSFATESAASIVPREVGIYVGVSETTPALDWTAAIERFYFPAGDDDGGSDDPPPPPPGDETGIVDGYLRKAQGDLAKLPGWLEGNRAFDESKAFIEGR